MDMKKRVMVVSEEFNKNSAEYTSLTEQLIKKKQDFMDNLIKKAITDDIITSVEVGAKTIMPDSMLSMAKLHEIIEGLPQRKKLLLLFNQKGFDKIVKSYPSQYIKNGGIKKIYGYEYKVIPYLKSECTIIDLAMAKSLMKAGEEVWQRYLDSL